MTENTSHNDSPGSPEHDDLESESEATGIDGLPESVQAELSSYRNSKSADDSDTTGNNPQPNAEGSDPDTHPDHPDDGIETETPNDAGDATPDNSPANADTVDADTDADTDSDTDTSDGSAATEVLDTDFTGVSIPGSVVPGNEEMGEFETRTESGCDVNDDASEETGAEFDEDEIISVESGAESEWTGEPDAVDSLLDEFEHDEHDPETANPPLDDNAADDVSVDTADSEQHTDDVDESLDSVTDGPSIVPFGTGDTESETGPGTVTDADFDGVEIEGSLDDSEGETGTIVVDSTDDETPASDLDIVVDDDSFGPEDEFVDTDFEGVEIEGSVSDPAADLNLDETIGDNDTDEGSRGEPMAAVAGDSDSETTGSVEREVDDGDSQTDSIPNVETISDGDIEPPEVPVEQRIRKPGELIGQPAQKTAASVKSIGGALIGIGGLLLQWFSIFMEWSATFLLMCYGFVVAMTVIFPPAALGYDPAMSRLSLILFASALILPFVIGVFSLSMLIDKWLNNGERYEGDVSFESV